jgi:ABC-type sugar transport system permease subunit
MIASLVMSFTDFDRARPAGRRSWPGQLRRMRGILGQPGGDPLIGNSLFIIIASRPSQSPSSGFARVAMLVNNTLWPSRHLRTLFYMPMQIRS